MEDTANSRRSEKYMDDGSTKLGTAQILSEARMVEEYREQESLLRAQVKAMEEKIQLYHNEDEIRKKSNEDRVAFLEKKLTHQVSQNESIMTALQSKTDLANALQNSLNEQTARAKALADKLDEYMTTNKTISTEFQQFSESVSKIKLGLQMHNQKITAQYETSISKINKEKAELANKLDNTISNYNESIKENTELTSLVQEYLQKIKLLEKEIEGVQDKNQELCRKLIASEKDQSRADTLLTKTKDLEEKLKTAKQQTQQESEDKLEFKRKLESMDKKYNTLVAKYSGENSLDSFKTKIAQSNTASEELKAEITKLKETNRKTDAKSSDIAKSYEKYKTTILKTIIALKQIISKFRPNLTVTQQSKEIKDCLIILDKQDQPLAKEVISLQAVLCDYKKENAQSLSEIVKENETLRSEILKTNNMKDDIVTEINRIKENMVKREMVNEQKDDQIARLREEQISLKDQIKTMLAEAATIESEDKLITEEIYRNLKEMGKKYECIDFISKQIKSNITTLYTQNKKKALFEVMEFISDILNIQNYEVKSLNIKLSEFEEIKKEMGRMKEESQKQMKRIEHERIAEIRKIDDTLNDKKNQLIVELRSDTK